MTTKETLKILEDAKSQSLFNGINEQALENAIYAIKTLYDPTAFIEQWAENNGYTLVANDVWKNAKKALEQQKTGK